MATVRLASEGEMPLAISRPVLPLGNSRFAPSGKVTAIFSVGSAGFRLVILYWNPDADSCLSGIDLSCGSLLRTSAGKRGNSGIAGDSGGAIGVPSRKSAENRLRH